MLKCRKYSRSRNYVYAEAKIANSYVPTDMSIHKRAVFVRARARVFSYTGIVIEIFIQLNIKKMFIQM